MFKQQNSTQNQKVVTSSAIVAKAVCRRMNGRYEIVVVFQKSTKHEFYWIFQVRSPRSPQRSWKFAGYAERDINFDNKSYFDFGSFVSHRTRLTGGQLVSERTPQRRLLAGLLAKTEHESIYSDWTPRETQPMATMMHKRGTGHKGRRSSWAS